MAPAPVLLLTHSADWGVPDRVLAALAARGARAVRVDTDRFPASASLTLSGDGRGLLAFDDEEVDLARVPAIWCRRLWTAHAAIDVAREDVAACAAQARDALSGALALADLDGRVINARAAEERAEHKPVQLRVARAVGFAVPPTLITNDPADARAFIERERDVVTKLLVPLSQTMDGSGPFMYTSAVAAGDIADLDALRAAPMIFQRRVEKHLEVRAMVVRGQVFAGAVATGALDWRQGTGGRWTRADLPPTVEDRCCALVKALGLVTGAIDLVVDRAGTHWFLEVNPAGEWGFLEMELGLPIADAIAGALVDVGHGEAGRA